MGKEPNGIKTLGFARVFDVPNVKTFRWDYQTLVPILNIKNTER